MAFIGDLLLRAGIELSGLQRDITRMQSMLSAIPEQLERSVAHINVVPPDAAQQGRTLAAELADGIQQGRKQVVDALGAATVEAVEEARAEIEAAGKAQVEFLDALRKAGEEAAGLTQVAEEARGVADALDGLTGQAGAMDEWTAATQRASEASAELVNAQEAASEQIVNLAEREAREKAAFAEYVARKEEELRAQKLAQEQRAAASSVENARKAAEAAAEALALQLKVEQARIKDGIVRGFLSPEEARQAGREAAEEYNAGMIEVLDRATAQMAFRDTEGQKSYAKLAGSLRDVDDAARRANVSMGRIHFTLGSIAARATGLPPVLGQLAGVLSTMASAGVVTVGVLGGISAMSWAYRKLTEDLRDAKKEAEALQERIQRVQQTQRLGIGGQIAADLATMRQQLDQVDQRLRAARENLERPFDPLLMAAGLAESQERLRIQAQINRLQEEERGIKEGLLSLERAQTDEAQARMADMLRAADQRLALAGLEGPDRARAQIDLAAQNALIDAHRTLTGELLEQKAIVIEMVRLREHEALAIEEARRAAEDAKRALQEEVSVLQQAAGLFPLRAQEIARSLQLEEQLRRAVQDTSRSLEERAKSAAMLKQLPSFDPRPAEIAISQAPVVVGGVTIENLDEMRRMYQEQVEAELERARVTALLDLRIRPTTRAHVQSSQDAVRLAQEATRAFNENIAAGMSVVSAFGSLAEATDELGIGMADALRGLETFANGLTMANYGRKLGADAGMLGPLAEISGYIGIAAGAMQAIGGLFGKQETPAQRMQREILESNNHLLEQQLLVLRGFSATPGAMQQAAEVMKGIQNIPWAGKTVHPEILDAMLPAGWTTEMLRAIDKALDTVQLFDESGRLIVAAIPDFIRAVEQASRAMIGFGDSLRELQQERDLRDRLQGVERTPEMQISALLGDIHTLSRDLFQQYLGDIDVSDFAAVRAAVVRMFDDFAAGGEAFLELMSAGGMDRSDILQWFGQVADSLSAMDNAVKEVAGSLRGVPQGFRVLNLELARFHAAQPERAMPPATTPIAAPFAGNPEPRTQVTDNRTYTIQVTQEPGEDAEMFAERVVEIVRRMDREDQLTYDGTPIGRRPAR